MISRIFIERPIFAWVIAILIMMSGIAAIFSLPIEQYPDVAPPQVNIRATYPGASAPTLEASVTQVIEQQLTGLDGLLYFSAASSARGTVVITATFEKGIDPDIAQVQVQNKVQQALPRLPQQVQQQGLTVTKANAGFLMIVGIYDESDRTTNLDVGDYISSSLVDRIGRLPGVGEVQAFGASYAMRIWLNPARLASYSLQPGDVIAAIQAQNAEVAAGEIGAQPMPAEQMLNATVTSQSRLETPEQFAQIILKSQPSGATVRLADVARIELGSESYAALARFNRHPAAGMAVNLAPGADALSTAEGVKAEMQRLAGTLPAGYKYTFPFDSTDFIKLSIEEVVKTLFEAIILVVIVMFLFLQSWRATLVPAITIPVVLLGTFAVFALFGFSINSLTMFGLALAIGLLVDDAIVVVENVERLLEENPEMTPHEATVQSMDQITIALIAIAAVLSAVFLPMAFFGGSTGVIYRQFSVTMVSAMVLSVVVALVLSPALTARLLKQRERHESDTHHTGRLAFIRNGAARFGNWFNRTFERTSDRYVRSITYVVDHKWMFLLVYAGVVALLAVLFLRLPTGFLPQEDQGSAIVVFELPAGATQSRSLEVQKTIENYLLGDESKYVERLFTASGISFGGGAGSQSSGIGFMMLKPFEERHDTASRADQITMRTMGAMSGVRDAQIYALVPPSIQGLGQSNGFTLELQNTGGLSHEAFTAARDRLLGMARGDQGLAAVRPTEQPDVPSLKVDLDQAKLNSLGINSNDVNTTLSAAWGGRYVNDFVDRGRVKRVFVQGDAPYRASPEDLAQWHVRGANGAMAPFSSFATTRWSQAPQTLARFQGTSSYQIQGQAGPGRSSGWAMERMTELAGQIPGVSVAWSGLSYQERLSSGQAPILYALSLLVVFLCLAALYESWSIPVAVLLVIPLGLVGAVFAVTLRGLQNDVFLQIGLLTTMGLASKNAILMIEFAERAEREGKRVIDAALEAARIRLRPIIMTSMAFIFGVLPLALSSGAGANSRIAIGTSVIGGMLTATLLAIFYIPLFFVLVRRSVRDGIAKARGRPTGHPSTHQRPDGATEQPA